jgi:UDP-GlcNAc3NAcA epimerase
VVEVTGTLRVLYAMGTRPEFIRSAPVLQELGRRPEVEVVAISTGQHYDRNMAAGFAQELRLPTMQASLHTRGLPRHEQVSVIACEVGKLVTQYRPSCVCVFGDTNSTLGSAIGGVTAGCPVVHIEAGARSFDPSMPEEVNRRIVDHCADLLLAVSSRCAKNLLREHVTGSVVDVGDPLYEVFIAEWRRESNESVESGQTGVRSCLMTLHRQALLDDRRQLSLVLDSVSEFAIAESVQVHYPIHPHTASILREQRVRLGPGITPTQPLLYGELIQLLRRSVLVITDSGGLQKEAFWAGRPCVTVRPNTEWTETIRARANRLAQGANVGRAARTMLRRDLQEADGRTDPYHGLGSSERIVAAIVERYASS